MINNNLYKSGGRVGYIDLLKGLAIIGVVFVHVPGKPEWWSSYYVNTIFFFLAGIFFRGKSISDTISEKWRSLMIPFLIYYAISYPIALLEIGWDTRSINNLPWGCWSDIFKSTINSDYLRVNVPLWFIPALFITTILYTALSKLPKRIFLSVFILLFFCSEMIRNNWSAPFFINTSFRAIVFFGCGNLIGPYIINAQYSARKKYFILLFSAIAFITTSYIMPDTESEFINGIIFNIHWIAYCIGILTIFSFHKDSGKTNYIAFLGANTLTILAVHWYVLDLAHRMVFKLSGTENPFLATIETMICIILTIPIIMYVNRKYPILTGKKKRQTRIMQTSQIK